MRLGLVAGAILGVVAAGYVFTAFDHSGGQAIGVQPRPENVIIQLGGSFHPQYSGAIVADRAGLLGSVSSSVELREAVPGIDPIDAVVAGKATFGVTDSVKFLAAYSKGSKIVAFGAGLVEPPIVFYTLANSGIRSPRNFVGHRVVREPGTDSAIIYDAMLARAGIARSRMLEELRKAELPLLIEGKVDVLPGKAGEEGYLLQQKEIRYRVIRPPDHGIHIPGTVYFTKEGLVRDYPSLVVGFLKAMIAGWELVYANYAKSIPMLAEATGLSPDRVRFQLDAQRGHVRPLARRIAEFDDLQWRQLHDILSQQRIIGGTVDLSKAVDFSLLREAYRKSVANSQSTQ